VDDLPAKYFAIPLCTLFIIAWCCYELSGWLRQRIRYQSGDISERSYTLFTLTSATTTAMIIYFINIFAVHPRDNFPLHTLPFTVMVMAVSINAIRTSLRSMLVCNQHIST